MCKLPDGVANSDIGDLKERIELHIDPALRYACRSWHTHLVDRHTTQVDTQELTSALHRFLEKKFLFWLEVLSVLGALREAVNALDATAKSKWLDVGYLLLRVYIQRFTPVGSRCRPTTFVSLSHFSTSSAHPRHISTTLRSPYPPKRRSFVSCTNNTRVPL